MSHKKDLFGELSRIVRRPKPFEHYTSPKLWNDAHISKGMLDAHLDPSSDVASFRTEFIDKAVDWMIRRFDICRNTDICGNTRICDFGCGPGLWTTRFAESGADVTGIDLSERSVRHAQNVANNKNLAIRYILQDYLQFSLDERFDLITMIYEDFSVLSPEQRTTLLKTFRKLLSDDGTLFLDVTSMQHFNDATEKTEYQYIPKGGFWSPGPHHVFKNSFKYERDHLLCDKYTVVENESEFEVFNWIQCYSVESLNKTFEQNGLRIVESFADVAGTPLTDDSRAFAAAATKSG
jgi:2-polyprenyl-3-methyl-5-hydroxy-6-metoxy-1,4-benzoquinol methylase